MWDLGYWRLCSLATHHGPALDIRLRSLSGWFSCSIYWNSLIFPLLSFVFLSSISAALEPMEIANQEHFLAFPLASSFLFFPLPHAPFPFSAVLDLADVPGDSWEYVTTPPMSSIFYCFHRSHSPSQSVWLMPSQCTCHLSLAAVMDLPDGAAPTALNTPPPHLLTFHLHSGFF